jgi:hypothetical protein
MLTEPLLRELESIGPEGLSSAGTGGVKNAVNDNIVIILKA